MNHKPIYDALRKIIDERMTAINAKFRGLTQAEVDMMNAAIDAALAGDDGLPITVIGSTFSTSHRLGALSEKYETGGRGPGTVSSGVNDPGGVSYGCYQLASKTPTLKAFLSSEGLPWANELAQGGVGGSSGFSAKWKYIAEREPNNFTEAQHNFIERTHYRPVMERIKSRTGIDLDTRHPAIKDVVWSCAVQHGQAIAILEPAVHLAGNKSDRDLINAIYDERIKYVQKLKALKNTTRDSLLNRYADERKDALAMLNT